MPLDPHIQYAVTPGPAAERDSAIGLPGGVAWSANGQRVYVTSLDSAVPSASRSTHVNRPAAS